MCAQKNNELAPVIHTAIEQAIHYIPVVWPLQQFVAINPLWDCIDQPIADATQAIQEKFSIQSTLSFFEYWQHYTTGRITNSAIKEAISQGLNQHTVKSCHATDQTELTLYQHLIYDFFVDESAQKHLAADQNTAKKNPPKLSKILFSKQVKPYSYDSAFDFVESECLNWLQTYFNPTEPQKNILFKLINDSSHPHFSHFWRFFSSQKSNIWRSLLTRDPEEITLFIQHLLNELKVPRESVNQYIMQICWQLKGWIGYIKWQNQYPDNPYAIKHIKAIEVVAMWLAHEVFWLHSHQKELTQFKPNYQITQFNQPDELTPPAWKKYLNRSTVSLDRTYPLTIARIGWLWQRAYELSYQRPLYESLIRQKNKKDQNHIPPSVTNTATQRPTSQWIFCIDVRSEGLRRHLEHAGAHATFGCAGFFGLTYQLKDNGSQKLTNQCPAILSPTFKVELNEPLPATSQQVATHLATVINENKKTLLSPFVLYESVGPWLFIPLLLRSYANTCWNLITHFFCKKKLTHTSPLTISGLESDKAAELVGNFLCTLGLTKTFSDFVIVCGHQAQTENNPYQAALECGACGGNSGATHATLACTLLNDQLIRNKLRLTGIEIPDSTTFIPACHNTTTDEIIWHGSAITLASHQKQLLNRVKRDADKASELLREERRKTLPGDHNVLRRARHWAELIPEWGLANNAAMVIAPRQITAALNLERRAFLHCYDSHLDPTGEILQSILSGPVIVAHWINSQYYFSAVAPHAFSSGNKAIHNILPNVGVMEGNQSDLKYGLPEQSLFYRGIRRHEPMRLHVFIDAEEDKIQKIINKNNTLKSLCEGQWIFITSLHSTNRAVQ